MKNKISINHEKYVGDKAWVIDTFPGIFLSCAEEDYVAFRVLIILDRVNISYYHFQQCIEKYLKAFVLYNNIEIVAGKKNECKDFKKNGHRLEYWAEICGRKDNFFNDSDFMTALKSISDFEELYRYPQDNIQTWGSSPKEILKFMDEFVWEMRKKITHTQYQDIIEAFLSGFSNSDPRIYTLFKYSFTVSQIREFLILENDYFKIS